MPSREKEKINNKNVHRWLGHDFSGPGKNPNPNQDDINHGAPTSISRIMRYVAIDSSPLRVERAGYRGLRISGTLHGQCFASELGGRGVVRAQAENVSTEG